MHDECCHFCVYIGVLPLALLARVTCVSVCEGVCVCVLLLCPMHSVQTSVLYLVIKC